MLHNTTRQKIPPYQTWAVSASVTRGQGATRTAYATMGAASSQPAATTANGSVAVVGSMRDALGDSPIVELLSPSSAHPYAMSPDPAPTVAPPLSPLAARVAEVFPTLAGAPPVTLERIAKAAVYRKVQAGSVMFSEHSPCGGFPLVLAGSVRVLQRYPNGRELQLYRVKPGESCLLSGSCLLGHTDYDASGIAETDVELLVLPPAEFNALIAEDETFRRHVFSLFGERLAAVLQIVEAVAYQKLDQRLAALLVAKPGREINATHQSLADELGSVREIVTRLLRTFEDRGWVELGRERISIRDRDAIAALAKG